MKAVESTTVTMKVAYRVSEKTTVAAERRIGTQGYLIVTCTAGDANVARHAVAETAEQLRDALTRSLDG